MPVRKVKKSYRNVTGVSAARKAVGDAQFESTLERDFLRLLEFSPDVEGFEVQPLGLPWRDPAGTQRNYTPDTLVTFHASTGLKPWLCEVKYRSDLKKDWIELKPKFRHAIRYARKKGWRFRLVTEVEIRGPELEAANFLLPFRHRSIPDEQSDRLLALLAAQGETTPLNLLHEISCDPMVQAEWLPALWHLVARFKIGMDFHSPITMYSRIWSLQ